MVIKTNPQPQSLPFTQVTLQFVDNFCMVERNLLFMLIESIAVAATINRFLFSLTPADIDYYQEKKI